MQSSTGSNSVWLADEIHFKLALTNGTPRIETAESVNHIIDTLKQYGRIVEIYHLLRHELYWMKCPSDLSSYLILFFDNLVARISSLH